MSKDIKYKIDPDNLSHKIVDTFNAREAIIKNLVRDRERRLEKAIIDLGWTPPSDAGWQPIEAAPSKITRILAWDGVSCDVIEWGDNWCSHGCYMPTHWMPLPTPPQNENE